MKDYYAILGISQEATKFDIRKAYRKLAKELHPDVAQKETKAGNSFIILKEAYEILINSETRANYDVSRHTEKSGDDFDFREFLKKRSEDQVSMSRLICFDLLHDREAQAVELYDNLTESGIFDFRRYVDREAFMDFSFLLSEEYIKQGCPVKAFRIMFSIALLEEDEPYFRHFYPEVLAHLFRICRRPIDEDHNDLLRLRFLTDISALDYPDRDRARIYKLISEIYSKQRDLDSAAGYLYKAFRLCPGLEGVKEAVDALERFFPESG